MHVLIAEDNQFMAEIIELWFKRSGATVVVASNGREALDLATQGNFDLVITDFDMPELNGTELSRGLRNLPHHQATPVMLCTASGHEYNNERFRIDNGISEVITKPFCLAEMVETAQRLTSVRPTPVSHSVRQQAPHM